MHSHTHAHAGPGRGIVLALALTSLLFVVEIFVGFKANSLALLSDAGHMLTDIFAFGVAWFALQRSERAADERYTFGYRRASILSALANALLLVVIAAVISFEAVSRLQHPPHSTGWLIVGTAVAATFLNGAIAFGLREAAKQSLNIRAALLHVMGDMAASVGVAVAGCLIIAFHFYVADPIISMAIAVLIAVGAWRIVSESLGILMEATPQGVDLTAVTDSMQQVPGVEGVHDLHIWELADGFRLLSAHVMVPDQTLTEAAAISSDLRMILAGRFGIRHSTIEIECRDCTVPVSRPIHIERFQRGDV